MTENTTPTFKPGDRVRAMLSQRLGTVVDGPNDYGACNVDVDGVGARSLLAALLEPVDAPSPDAKFEAEMQTHRERNDRARALVENAHENGWQWVALSVADLEALLAEATR